MELMVCDRPVSCSLRQRSLCICVTASVGIFSAWESKVSATRGIYCRSALFCSSANSICTFTWHASAWVPPAYCACICMGPKKVQATFVDASVCAVFVSRYALANALVWTLAFVKKGRTCGVAADYYWFYMINKMSVWTRLFKTFI